MYASLIEDIQNNATRLRGKYAFLREYSYSLGEENLTAFGEREMVESGVELYRRYPRLTRDDAPFIRASDQERVVVSGEKFIQGYENAKRRDPDAGLGQTPEINVVIPEGEHANNTLDPKTCIRFKHGTLGDDVSGYFTSLIAPAIRERLEADIPGVELRDADVISLMDLCPFETVARTDDASELSPFCELFTASEWTKYNYLRSLEKYYAHGAGNSLGATQGVGYANEVIARLTHSGVHDHTSTNTTLDSNPATFPLNATLYADFGHDNGMTSIFFALGLYNNTPPLSRSIVQDTVQTDGYSAAWTVPFAARAYIEMMHCGSEGDEDEPLVRVLVNDRVVPLHGCRADWLGRCRRDEFVRALAWAREGGDWGRCFD